MNIVQITTVIFDNKRLDSNAEAWLKPQVESAIENGSALELRPGVVLKRCDSSRIVEFGGGPTVKGGFSYEFSEFGNDARMIFTGEEHDYGFGDIRQILGDCQVSDSVIVQHLSVETKTWPK